MRIRNRNTLRDNSKDFSSWSSLSIIEKFTMITLPCMKSYITYMICDSIFGGKDGLEWWVILIISIGIVSLIITILYFVISWLIENDY
jgi:phosphoglycerol transferase MdoB-like AlkP superfamily enzyme